MNQIKNKIIVSGITATGNLTIANYLGAIQNFLKLQNDNQLFIFIANLHAITVPYDPKTLKANILEMVALYYACGLSLDKVKIFVQSEIPAHSELAHILLCHTTIGELSRMTQFKDKSQKVTAKNGSNYIPTGLLTYPSLMAADILLYDADYVPVGYDQKQHIELTRNIAIRLNNRFQKLLFKIPEEITSKTAFKIRDLVNPLKKMSKSSTNPKTYVRILDDEKTIYKKINGALTDFENKVYYDMGKKPGISNLLNIYVSLKNITMQQAEAEFKGKDYQIFKRAVAKVIYDTFAPIQKKYFELIKNENNIKNLLKQNSNFVNKLTKRKIEKVQKTIGLKIY